MGDIALRFLVGGLVVSTFAVLGDLFQPKSFAGLFGAAPSVALASLGLVVLSKGKIYAAVEARSMILGGVAFLVYAVLVSALMLRLKPSAVRATIGLLPVWLGAALGLWWLVMR
jgi:Protein of unknown function (DUF3147)